MRGAQQRNGTGRVDRSTHRSSRVGPPRSTSVSGIALRGCREQPGEPEFAGQVREGGRSPRQPAPVRAHVRGTNQVDLRLKASARKVRLSSAVPGSTECPAGVGARGPPFRSARTASRIHAPRRGGGGFGHGRGQPASKPTGSIRWRRSSWQLWVAVPWLGGLMGLLRTGHRSRSLDPATAGSSGSGTRDEGSLRTRGGVRTLMEAGTGSGQRLSDRSTRGS